MSELKRDPLDDGNKPVIPFARREQQPDPGPRVATTVLEKMDAMRRQQTAARVLAGLVANPQNKGEAFQVLAKQAVNLADALTAALAAKPDPDAA